MTTRRSTQAASRAGSFGLLAAVGLIAALVLAAPVFAGGKGGKGGNGGHGGGGGGGPAVGIVCASGFAVTDQVSYVLGLAGDGGQSPGKAGEPGLRAETWGCGG